MNVCVAVRKRAISLPVGVGACEYFLLEFLSMTTINRDGEVRETKIKDLLGRKRDVIVIARDFCLVSLFGFFSFYVCLKKKSFFLLVIKQKTTPFRIKTS